MAKIKMRSRPPKGTFKHPKRSNRRAKKGTQSTAVAKVSYSSGTALLAPTYIGKLRYRTILTQPFGTTDIPVRQIYRATSINDPDESKTGFQPSTHDELSLFYNHYIVLGSKITVKAILKASHVGNMFVFLSRTDDVTTTNRNTVTEMLNDLNTKRIVLNQENRAATISHTYSKKQLFGNRIDSKLEGNLLNTASQPAENIYFQLSSVNFEAGDQPVSVTYEVTIDYIVKCYERKSISTS